MKSRSNRNLGLDILRCTALFLVIGAHLTQTNIEIKVFRVWATGGWAGVDLFFVLSGYLVSGLLFEEYKRRKSLHIVRFLIRRAFKIYPAFYVMILVTIILRTTTGEGIYINELVGEVVFLQNYLGGFWGHTWSLAVEEHFYLLLAAILGVTYRYFPKSEFKCLPVIFVVLAVVCFLLRLSNLVYHPDYSLERYLFPTHIRIDSLFFGVFISYFVHFRGLLKRVESIHSGWLLGVGVALFVPVFVWFLPDYRWVSIGCVILLYLGSGCLLLAAIRLEESSSRILIVLGGIGANSYSIYLWHMPFTVWGHRLVYDVWEINSFWLYFCIYVFGSLIVGQGMNRLIERPALSVRDRFFPGLNRQAETRRTEIPDSDEGNARR